MQKILITIVLWVFLGPTNLLQSQSDNDKELHNRYWVYRENLRKHFTSIGERSGMGLPFSNIDVSASFTYTKIDGSGADINDSIALVGRLNTGGDLTAYMAEYMGILSSEYRLLKNQGLDGSDEMKAVKSELYFAINAIERLDKYSQQYFEPANHASPTVDGFFVRDDSEPKVTQYLDVCNYPKVQFVSSIPCQGRDLTYADYAHEKYISWVPDALTNQAIYFRFNKQKEYNFKYRDQFASQFANDPERTIEMSMDQLIGVLFGFKCIVKFVDPDVDVDPDGTGPLPIKNLNSWVRALTDKMMLHLSKTSYNVHLKAQNDLDESRRKKCEEKNNKLWIPLVGGFGVRYSDQVTCMLIHGVCVKDPCNDWKKDTEEKWNPILASHANYVLTNPNNGDKEVYRGFQAFAFGYPLEKIGEEITGNDYPEVSLTLSPLFQGTRVVLDVIGAALAPKTGGASLVISPDVLSLLALGRPLQPQNASWWRDVYNTIPEVGEKTDFIKKSDAAGMFIWLPAASGTWKHSEYYNMMSDYKRQEADLLYSVLNDETPYVSPTYIEGRLLNSNCEAIQNEVNESTHSPFNKVSYFSHIGSNGNGEKGYINNWWDTEGAKDEVSLYNGMDWMLIYNFYRMADARNLEVMKQWNKLLNYPKKFTRIPPHYWKNNTNINPFERLPKYENNYCPCKSSYEFYADRSAIEGKPHVYFNTSHIGRIPPLSPPTAENKDLGTLKMFNKDYESYGIHLSDYLTQNFTVYNTGLLKPEGNLTVCGNGATLTIKNGGELKTAANPKFSIYTYHPGQTIKINKGATLVIENGGTLTLLDSTKLIIEEGAKLQFQKGAIINLRGPHSELIIRGTVELKDDATFQISMLAPGVGVLNPGLDRYNQHGQVIIDRWYRQGVVQPLAFTSTTGQGRVNFTGKFKGDLLLKVIGNDGLTLASTQIESAKFKDCRVSFGDKDAKLHLEPKNAVWIENMVFTCVGDNDLTYQGVSIAGSTNYITNSSFKNARIGIDFNYLKRNGNPDHLNLNKVDFFRCTQAIRVDGSMIYNGGSINYFGEKGIQIIGDDQHSVMNGVTIESLQPLDLLGKYYTTEINSKALSYHGTSITLQKNTFGISNGNSYADYSKLDLLSDKTMLYCNKFDKSKGFHIVQNQGRLNLRGNTFEHFSPFGGAQIYTNNTQLQLKGGYNMLDDYAYSRYIFNANLNKALQERMYLVNPTPGYPPAPYFDKIDATDNYLHLVLRTPSSPDGSSYNTHFKTIGFPTEHLFLESTPDYNTANSTHMSRNDFLALRDDFCATKLTNRNINPANGIEIFPIGPGTEFHKRSDNGWRDPFGTRDLPHDDADSLMTDTTVHLFFKWHGFTKLNKLEFLHYPVTSTVPISTITLGTMGLGEFYDSAMSQLYGNPYTNIDNWIYDITTVLSSDTIPTDSLTNMYRDELLEDLTFAVGKGIDCRQFYVSQANTVELDSAIKAVADFYDSAWAWANAGHPYWSKRKTTVAENWARTYRQGEKRQLALDVLNLTLDSLQDENSQKILTAWKCINSAEIIYLRDSISIDSFYKLLTCMPSINEVPVDSMSIEYDTLSYCHWDSTVLMKPDGARVNAGSRPHYIMNLVDSSIVSNLNDNLYYLKEGNYKLIYTPTFLTEYEIKQLAVYKNIFQSDTIDSTYAICSLSSFDTCLFRMPWDVESSIENTEDTSSIFLDSNFMAHLPSGNYIIRFFDSANCQMRVTNLSVMVNAADTLTMDSTLIATDWSSTGLSALTKVPFYPSVNGMPYSIQNLADSGFLPDTNSVIYLAEGNYLVKTIDTINCQVVFTNLTIEVDTPLLEIQDTTVYFCQFGDSSAYQYDTLLKYIPVTIRRIEPTEDSVFTNFLMEGVYVIKYYDTLGDKIYQTNLTVSPNGIDNDTVSRSISYCDWSAFGFDTLGYYDLGYAIYADSLPHIIETNSFPADTLSNDTLLSGTYKVTSYDFNNCKIIITNLTVTSDTSEIVEDDSTMSYCDWTGSGINAQSYVSYYTPYITPRITIVRTSPSIDTMETNHLTEGEYTITVYAIYDCARYVTHLTVNGTDPDVETLDTSLSYCNTSEWSGVHYTISDTLPYTFIMTSPVADSSLSDFLTDGSYTIRHYDTNNCRIIQTNLTITASEFETVYGKDTLDYYCENDSQVMYTPSCANGIVNDKDGIPLELVEGAYILNPHEGYYIRHCVDTIGCVIYEDTLCFSDIIDVPYATEDYAYGTFNRRESDSCCFVPVDNLVCSGTELAEGDEIEIFDIDESQATTFLFGTTLHYYGTTHVLGFKFCPPLWDISEEHINDWYSMVMKSDTCRFCRFDFMCDSTVELSMVGAKMKQDHSTGINRTPNQKVATNVSAVDKINNTIGGITKIAIFPNPTNSEVNIRITNLTGNNVKINIYDNAGKRVYMNNYSTNKDISLKINMSDFESGVYTINIPELNYNYKLILIK